MYSNITFVNILKTVNDINQMLYSITDELGDESYPYTYDIIQYLEENDSLGLIHIAYNINEDRKKIMKYVGMEYSSENERMFRKIWMEGLVIKQKC